MRFFFHTGFFKPTSCSHRKGVLKTQWICKSSESTIAITYPHPEVVLFPAVAVHKNWSKRSCVSWIYARMAEERRLKWGSNDLCWTSSANWPSSFHCCWITLAFVIHPMNRPCNGSLALVDLQWGLCQRSLAPRHYQTLNLILMTLVFNLQIVTFFGDRGFLPKALFLIERSWFARFSQGIIVDFCAPRMWLVAAKAFAAPAGLWIYRRTKQLWQLNKALLEL